MPRPQALLWGAVIAVAVSARFVFETTLVDRLPAAVAVFGAVVPAALAVMAASFRLPSRLDRRDAVAASAAGVLGFWLAPFLVAVWRGSDAPSGSEVLFLTSAAAGLVLVAGAVVASRRFEPVRLAGALLGVVAAAGILANWERPSSFSPFVKFPRIETLMVLAAVAFAAAVYLLEGVVRRRGALAALRPAAIGAGAAAIAAAFVLSPASIPDLARAEAWPFAMFGASATFAIMLAWARGLVRESPDVLAAAYFLAPPLLTGFSFVERRLGALGPDPIRWGAAAPSVVLALAAVALVALTVRDGSTRDRSDRFVIAARVVAVAAMVAAGIGLLGTDIFVSVSGIRSTGARFFAEFGMIGAETAGGWLAFCCTLFAAAWAWRPAVPVREHVLRACVLAVAVAAWFPVHATPLHTWNRWIPPEVQQDYGTEYAKRTERPVTNAWELVALAGAAASAALVLVGRPDGEADRVRREVPTA